jgi:hypothetical protein
MKRGPLRDHRTWATPYDPGHPLRRRFAELPAATLPRVSSTRAPGPEATGRPPGAALPAGGPESLSRVSGTDRCPRVLTDERG